MFIKIINLTKLKFNLNSNLTAEKTKQNILAETYYCGSKYSMASVPA